MVSTPADQRQELGNVGAEIREAGWRHVSGGPGMQGAEIPGVAPGPGGALVSPPACADARLAGQERSAGIPLPPPKLSEAFRPPASSRGPPPAGIVRMPRRADPAFPACLLNTLTPMPCSAKDVPSSAPMHKFLYPTEKCQNFTLFRVTNS